MAIPAVLIGAVAKSTDWNATGLPANYIKNGTIGDPRLTLPLVLQYLTPTAISFIGLGAISAAVMSSADSSVLSASSMFAYNIYKVIFRPKATPKEMIWVIRVGIFVVGGIATVMGLTITSIYGLWFLCSDLVFVILFPHLLGAVHISKTNIYGSLIAGPLGLILRLGGGENLIGLDPFIEFPYYICEGKEEGMLCGSDGQLFPFRTLCMLITLITLVGVSYLTDYLFSNGIVDISWDYFEAMERNKRLAAEDLKMKTSTANGANKVTPSVMYTGGKQNGSYEAQDEGVQLKGVTSA